MDNIQRELIKAGRKDLAQQYYEKTASKNIDEKINKLKKFKDGLEKSINQLDQINKILKNNNIKISGNITIKFKKTSFGNELVITIPVKLPQKEYKDYFDIQKIRGPIVGIGAAVQMELGKKDDEYLITVQNLKAI